MNLVNQKDLFAVLQKKEYKYFVDERGTMLHINHLEILLISKYGIEDWECRLRKIGGQTLLSFTSVSGFEYRFPLRK